MNPLSSIALGSTAPRFPHQFIALALVPLLAGLSEQSATAQAWQQNPQDPPPQYQASQYVQPSPNYVPSAAPPSPYGYPQQTGPQPPYAQPQQYAQPGPYGQQPQYAPPPEPQYPVSGQPDAGLADPQQFAQQGAPAPPQGFAAGQLQQLVAPIALYPDNLVAQILAASTYPAQVIAADNWLHAQGYASPDQIAYGADAQTNWDPSVKALTAFPQVLDLMNHDLGWTTDLGNAYFNQPQDVLQTIQVMRQRAEQAGTLESTPQQQVSYDQGYIQVAPVNPQVVYVPSYNPWGAYGQPVSPYPGFSLFGALQSLAGSGFVRFGLGVALSAFSHTPFGWAGWALNWLASSIFFHQSPYTSHSTSVAHWGNGAGYYGGQRALINRTPNGYGRQQTYDRSALARGARGPENYAYGRSDNRAFSGNYGRPAVSSYASGRPQAESPQSVRAQAYARPGAYGNGFYGGLQPGYGARAYAAPQQAYRGPAQNYQRNDYAQRSLAERSYAEPRSYSGRGGYAEAYAKQERSEGSHLFGGHGQSHESFKAPKAPKAPKMSGGHHGGGKSRH
jgi:Protein of unknown function (DUF3300)